MYRVLNGRVAMNEPLWLMAHRAYTDHRSYRKLLTVGEAAAILSVHVNTLKRWDAGGILTAYRVGPRRDRRFHRTDVIRMLRGAAG